MNTHEARDAPAIEAKPESLNRRRLKGPFHRTIIDHAVERIKISSGSIVPGLWPRIGRGSGLVRRIISLSFNPGLRTGDPRTVLFKRPAATNSIISSGCNYNRVRIAR